MANEKVRTTLSDFMQKLKNGGYGSATGARRAVGKMGSWTEEDKAAASKKIASHFGVEAEGSSKAAPSKTGRATTAGSGAQGPGPGRGRKKKVEKKQVAKASHGRQDSTREQSEDSHDAAYTDAARRADVIDKSQRAVHVVASALNVLAQCKENGAKVDEGYDTSSRVVTQCLENLRRVVVEPIAADLGMGPAVNLPQEDVRAAELFSKAVTAVEATSAPSVPQNGTSAPRIAPPQLTPMLNFDERMP